MTDHDHTAVAQVQARIDRLEAIADRWQVASPRMARRARDKADGLATALRLLEPHLTEWSDVDPATSTGGVAWAPRVKP